MKKWLGLFGIILLGVALFFCFQVSGKKPSDYGVFIGMEKKDLLQLSKSYQTLVLDVTYLDKTDIKQLHFRSRQIFAYLNIGALETSNSFYQDFKDLTFKPYDNWPDESWIHVTDSAWQDFLVHQLAQSLKDKGVDGLFLDNFDVYDHDQRPEVYASLVQLLKEFQTMNLPVIINGGSTFVSQFLAEDPQLARQLIYAVNQESVFLAYDFDAGKPVQQTAEAEDFYLDYLNNLSQTGLQVFLIEYGADSHQAHQISKQCQDLNYTLYLAPSILLDRE
ncbi:endo alpha-1,4 polygalactosaminidase [Streptococcus oriscaviae]|uniref:Endo alpha-1,4 polygalactosaminidase n=1 Tax=Streptococcus oriscaviae TaxID=2781599 RepID=A0ABX7YND2_9STRE|nr:endo alpha-1,4 polygalactosaminidase [Streptococcus oriscaviae]QUE55167.1 endo alpha-1,4 polygalactosaminidase [Streptococcus oriscaviae]